jgi:hypothetical protein
MVEEGRFAIDNFLVYQLDESGQDVVRLPVTKGEFEWEGKRNRLCWVDMTWSKFVLLGSQPLGDAVKATIVEKCASGDIGYVEKTGHLHPNKPPGTSFFGVPGYFLIYHLERLLGIRPDGWWALDVNAWLTSVLSVGICAALGAVLFFRLARDFAGGAIVPALFATFSFAFGTTYFPFATIFFDHALTAALLIAAFYFLRQTRHRPSLPTALLAGACAGFAVLTNFVALLAVALLGLYALLAPRPDRLRSVLAFVAGGIPPALLLIVYSYICYGSLRPGTDFQNPLFRDETLFLGMFTLPKSLKDLWTVFYIVKVLLYSPFRGVFWFSPVLLLSFGGLFVWARGRLLVPEALLCLGVFLAFFGVNSLFNGFHAGFTAGPRYLVPGLPFLALPLVAVFAHPWWRSVAGALAVYSIAVQLVLTATDAQNPVGVGGHARVENRHKDWKYDLLGEYAVPLFFQGKAWPLLRQQVEVELDKFEQKMDDEGLDAVERQARREAFRAELIEAIKQGRPSPFLLGSITGPVSVNPIGAFEGLLTYQFFQPGSPQVQWASFNLGELLFPQSRWSLVPLLLLTGALSAWAIRRGSAQ